MASTKIDIPVCKYCLENTQECKSVFITPCQCTNPVCSKCLKKKISLDNKIICEICKSKYNLPSDIDITQIISENIPINSLSRTDNRLYINRLIRYPYPLMDNGWPQYVAHEYFQENGAADDSDNKFMIYCITTIIIIFTLFIILMFVNLL